MANIFWPIIFKEFKRLLWNTLPQEFPQTAYSSQFFVQWAPPSSINRHSVCRPQVRNVAKTAPPLPPPPPAPPHSRHLSHPGRCIALIREVCVQAGFKSFRICIITMDSSKASLTISDPSEDNEKRKYSLRIDYAAKVSRVMTCIVKDTFS